MITDATVLIRDDSQPALTLPRAAEGLMLAGRSLQNFDWEVICGNAGVVFNSCHWSVDRVLAEVRRCDVLLTEAKHGAIIADALRISGIPITGSNVAMEFKSRDWLSSVFVAIRLAVRKVNHVAGPNVPKANEEILSALSSKRYGGCAPNRKVSLEEAPCLAAKLTLSMRSTKPGARRIDYPQS